MEFTEAYNKIFFDLWPFLCRTSESCSNESARGRSFFRNMRSKFLDIRDNDCLVRLLLLTFILSTLVILPAFTQLTNIVTEYGVEGHHIAYLWSLSTFCDFVMRPIWGQASRFFSVSSLIIFEMLLWILLNLVLIFYRNLTGFYITFAVLGVAISGYGGFKGVLIVEIFGVRKIPSFIVFEQLILCPGEDFKSRENHTPFKICEIKKITINNHKT